MAAGGRARGRRRRQQRRRQQERRLLRVARRLGVQLMQVLLPLLLHGNANSTAVKSNGQSKPHELPTCMWTTCVASAQRSATGPTCTTQRVVQVTQQICSSCLGNHGAEGTNAAALPDGSTGAAPPAALLPPRRCWTFATAPCQPTAEKLTPPAPRPCCRPRRRCCPWQHPAATAASAACPAPPAALLPMSIR